MKSITKAFAKGTFATVAAGALAVTAASPAAAQDRHRDRGNNGISTGEVIAGAVILGGLAAIIASSDNDDRYDRRDRNYNNRDNYNNRGNYNNRRNANYRNNGNNNGRRAVEACVNAAERIAQRYSGSRAEVYEIRDVDRERRGFEVKGRIAVSENFRGRGNRGDYRRGSRNNGWDEGRFECDFRNGRVVDVDFSGIRGL